MFRTRQNPAEWPLSSSSIWTPCATASCPNSCSATPRSTLPFKALPIGVKAIDGRVTAYTDMTQSRKLEAELRRLRKDDRPRPHQEELP
jgi:hypothetical protein